MAGAVTRAVGVDFGTSTSLVAERDGAGAPEVLPLGRRTRAMPSLAAVRGAGLAVGEDVEAMPEERLIRSIKRFLTEGRDTVEVSTADGVASLTVDDVAGAILSEVARRADTNGLPLGDEPVLRIGCPAAWTGPQRARLLSLATKAGIPVDHSSLVDEPVAAGVAWLTYRHLAHADRVEGRALVFDMGGGTLDVAVLDVVGGPEPTIRVLASVGAPEAGDDLDREIAADLAALLHAAGLDYDSHPRSRDIRDELLRQARLAKIRLSGVTDVTITFDAELFGVGSLVYTREQLEAVFAPQLDRALALATAAMRAARLTEIMAPSPMELRRMSMQELAHDVRYVVLAGGMSRIPVVARRLAEALPKADVHAGVGHLAADEVVVGGLADTVGYDRISLHRPAYDFVLEWDGGRRVLYEAYTPLYEPWKVALGHTFLGYDWYGTDLPRDGSGTLRVYTPAGEPVHLAFGADRVVGGADPRAGGASAADAAMPAGADGLRVQFGHKEFGFKIYCNGRIVVEDGVGRSFAARVAGWPMLRGIDHDARTHLEIVAEDPDPGVPWYFRERSESGAAMDMPPTATEDRVVDWHYAPRGSVEDRWHTEPEDMESAERAHRD